MSFITEQRDDVLLVTINIPRATLKEATEFKALLIGAIDKGKDKIAIDFNMCDYVDSTFLGVLVLILRRVTSTGGDVHLIGFKPAVRSMFELTRMHKVFNLYDNVADAIKGFKNK